ncbi:hypothetical protein MP638_007001 [Amoeboaphelidium occidentale]|nr:hypothetical protein MP638_007001 [Amoeboaphelidium occidentale]
MQQPIAQIAYSKEYTELLDKFKEIMTATEEPSNTLEITKNLLNLNPAHYTVWHYRQRFLTNKKSQELLMKELEFLNEFTLDNQKNYQVWRHRQFLISQITDGTSDKQTILQQEEQFLREVFDDEPKNYHAWTYRQWLVREFNSCEREIEFISRMLSADVMNNSVWNHRFVVYGKLDRLYTTSEKDFVMESIRSCPSNESAWNYLRAISPKEGLSEDLKQFCEEFKGNRFALEWLFEATHSEDIRQELIKADPVRKKYWESL